MTTDTTEETDGIVDRYASGGLAGLLVLAGAGLFLVPEPITSVIGAASVLAGVGSWALGHL